MGAMPEYAKISEPMTPTPPMPPAEPETGAANTKLKAIEPELLLRRFSRPA